MNLVELLAEPGVAASVLPPAPPDGGDRRPGAMLALSVDGARSRLPIGLADLQGGTPISASTVFDCASLAKPFVAACVVSLSADGLLDLDDRVVRLLPELGPPFEEVRVRHLLAHLSGIRDYPPLLALAGRRRRDLMTPDDVLALLIRQSSLGFPAGTDFEYSNSNYVLLTEIVQRTTGLSLSEVCAELCWRPTGLRSTSFRTDPATVVSGLAQSYEPSGTGYRNASTPSTVVGDSGLLTTVEDLLSWGEWLIASADSRVSRELTRPVTLPDGRRTPCGLGLFVGESDGLRWFGHGGSYDGFRAEWRVVPDRGLVAVVLSNWSRAEPARAVAAMVARARTVPAPSSTVAAPRSEGYLDQEGEAWLWCPSPPDAVALLSADRQVLLRKGDRSRLVGDDDGVAVECVVRADGGLDLRVGVRQLVLRPAGAAGGLENYAGTYWCEDLATEAVVSVHGGTLQWRRSNVSERLVPVAGDTFRAGATWLCFERGEGSVDTFRVSAPRAHGLRFVRVSAK